MRTINNSNLWKSVNSIGIRAFIQCKKLTLVKVSPKLNLIGSFAFFKYNSMSSFKKSGPLDTNIIWIPKAMIIH